MTPFRCYRVRLDSPTPWPVDEDQLALYRVLDAPAPLALAARGPATSCGLWTSADENYPLVLLARDLVTTARLVPLAEVVLEASEGECRRLEELVNGRRDPEGVLTPGLTLAGGAPRHVRVWCPSSGVLHRGDERRLYYVVG